MAPESRDEVRQRIDALYDLAENATGNYNATRAMTTGTRGRGVPLRKRPAADTDPDLDNVTRQWFDAARAKLGPTVPAVLPTDRKPQRPAERRPKAPAEREVLGDGRESTGRRLPELPAGSTGAPAGRALGELTRGSLPEPTRRPIAELTAGPSTQPAGGSAAALPAVPAPRRESEAPRARRAPATAPRRPSPGTSKERNLRKLTAARELLSRYGVQRTAPITAIEAAPAPGTRSTTETVARQGAQEEWRPPSWAVGLGVAAPSTDPTPPPAPDPLGPPDPPDPLDVTIPLEAADPLDTVIPLVAPGPPDVAPVTAPAPAPVHPNHSIDPGRFVPLGTGSTPEPVHADKAGKAVAFARAQIGRPCLWGATGPDAYDYASLTQAAWRAAGVALPRSAREQAFAGTPVALTGIRHGDLVFFFDNDSHVGLYVGNGMMVHAPGPGSYIREESIFGAGESAIHRVIRPA
ncbi:C40 family peptidase [Streptomyces brasiliensis]|uniref:NlpC/P60 domain-containing protein n=1 Tax=Streptomyces brasiliensis TaxID=1954 RepID=A0A917K0H8_9ACTN|nr:C40 family peptidase [Streptomyces brasiliensis]GGI96191.1 hypothetical protein GCM10010121_003320 [Streptomyces brasiliensis]